MLDLPAMFASQLAASLTMLHNCIKACPADNWDSPIAKYPFWHVAYHALCFGDLYSAESDEAWVPSEGPEGFHPAGKAELADEYPSRRFIQAELLRYSDYVCATAPKRLRAETLESLEAPSGFSWLHFNRAELHIYNARHVQHHAGQLSASLRRVEVAVPWSKVGG
jgi:hypothetical protein